MEIHLGWRMQEFQAKPQDEDGGEQKAQVWGQITHNVPSVYRAEPEMTVFIFGSFT